MHPDPRFRSQADPLDLAHRLGFAHVFVAGAEPMVVHAPVTRHGDALRFHVSRANRAVPCLDGTCSAIDEAALVDQLDTLASTHEPRMNPANPWTRAKMDPARFAAMLRGIVGFEVTPAATRTALKLSQNKPAADREGTAAGLRAAGFARLAAAVESAKT